MSEAGAIVDGASAGTLLREAREAAGLHVATLAATLKVPVRKLEALEEDQYEQLGDAVFIRALASSICRTLKIDPQPVLQKLPQTASPRLVQEGEGINAPFRAPGDGPSPGVLDQVSRPVMLTVMVLLLGALVLIFLPMAQRGGDIAGLTNNRSEPVMPPPGAAANVATTPVPVEAAPASTAAAPAESASAPAVAAAAPGVAPAATGAAAPAVASASSLAAASGARIAASPAPAAAPQAAASAPQAAASGPIGARGVVQFRTTGQSWIHVTDASGATVFRRLMEAGESAGAAGTLPLSVTVGSVGATEVQVRGKPYNLAPVSRDNVARFEVK
jgi:cytoskeleton protein RodZ